MTIRDVRRCQAGKAYTVTVWMQASRPATLVRVDLIEESQGARYAADTAVPRLTASAGSRWR